MYIFVRLFCAVKKNNFLLMISMSDLKISDNWRKDC